MAWEVRITAAALKRVAAVLVGAALVVAASFGLYALVRSEDAFGGLVDPSRYQSVVLSNGSIYFGHLREASDEFYELGDVWFLRDEPGEGEDDVVRRVVPLSEELHGPENRMLIPKEQLVLVENLPPDSPVNEAIRSASGER